MSDSSSRRRLFTGEHAYRVDSQRRIALPKAWRGDDPEHHEFVLVAPDEPCIHMMPRRMFSRAIDRMEDELFSNPAALISYGSIARFAADVRCDKQGRIALTAELMDHAHIDENVVLVGSFVTISLWSPDVWETHRQTLERGNLALRSVFTRRDNVPPAAHQAVREQSTS